MSDEMSLVSGRVALMAPKSFSSVLSNIVSDIPPGVKVVDLQDPPPLTIWSEKDETPHLTEIDYVH